MKTRHLLCAVSLAAAAFAFAPPALAQGQPARSLVVAEDVPPQTFDPTQSSQIRTWYVWQLVYEGLVVAGADGQIKPVLATKWTASNNNTEYVFELREGVVFSDGSPLTADDVVFSFERLLASGLPYAKDRFKRLKSVTRIDDRKVRFELSETDAGFLLNLGSPFLVGAGILSKKWAESNNPKTDMMGTGPFRMVSHSPNSQLVLERNDRHWNKDGAAKVEKLTVRYMPEQSAQIAGMKAGQIDLMFPSAETALVLKRDPSIKLLAVSSTNTIRLNLNTNREPWSKPDVRRALSLAINRDEVVKGVFLGEAVPSAQVPPSYSWAPKVSELKHQKHDPALAKELLARAGYPNGIDVTLNHLAGYATYLDRFSELLKAQAAAAGIRITIEANQNAVWLDKQNKANYEIMDNEYAYQADPLFYLMPRPGRQGPTPPEMQALIDKAVASDEASYTKNLRELLLMQDDLVFPDITVAARNAWVAHTAKVVSAQPDSTLSRSFLAGVAVK